MACHPTFRRPPILPRRNWILATLLLLLPFLSFAAPRTEIEIAPGPRSLTPDEKALAPDPQAGSEHGVILVDETIRDESAGTDSRVWRHVRAKIFTNEGRDLANVAIPNSTGALLKKYWGWTILPDGRVLEAKREDLQEQVTARSGAGKFAVLKGALPGVVPGCVIDYGYEIWQKGFYYSQRVELQRGWPVLSFSYRWVPWRRLVAAYRVARAGSLAVKVSHDSRALLVTARNLPAAVEEPWMPPRQEVLPSVVLYYRANSEKQEDFWNLEAKREARRAQDFIQEKPIREVLSSLSFPPGADLMARLRVAHEWITRNIKHTGFRSAEEEEADEDDESPAGARQVLAEKKASGRQLDYLFLGFARALGAEADMVLATDRTRHYFDPGVLSTRQFDWSLVSVRAPGDPDDKAVYVDTGSGVPFGELPWWITGSSALVASSKGARTVILRPSNPAKNRSETQVSITFHPEDETAEVHWTRADTGQAGLSKRLDLRSEGPEDRRKRLEGLCGSGGGFEVSRAEAPQLQDLEEGLHLDCQGTMMDTHFTAVLTRYDFGLDGFWNEPVPEFTAQQRVHPIIFQFPRFDHTVLDLRAPEGFAPVPPTSPEPVDSPYGRYKLVLTATPEGFHVERMFALGAIAVPAQEYESLRRFFAQVHQEDRTTVEFRKAGGQ